VQNFYRLLAASEEKVHNGTDVTVLQAVSHLIVFKSKLIIDLIPVKHNMSKDLYQSKKIVSDLRMNTTNKVVQGRDK
jgi:hypothetical protein